MSGEDELAALENRVAALESQAVDHRGRSTPTPAEIADYAKVRNALTVHPVDLTAGEIRNYLRVREFLFAEVEDLAIPTCRPVARRGGGGSGAVGRMGDLG